MASEQISDVVLTIRRQFQRLGIKPPSAIHLPDHESGMRFLAAARSELAISRGERFLRTPAYEAIPIECPDGSVWMEIIVADIAIRWPAQRRATRPAGYEFT